MFRINPKYVKRLSFSSKLFPRLSSALNLNTEKLTADHYDGEVFCGGRSINRDILTFFGFINDPLGTGSFVHLPLFRRCLDKLTNLVESELEAVGAQKILMPTLVPQYLWTKSKRLERTANAFDSVYRLVDPGDKKLLLGPTFEETVTKTVAGFDNIQSSELPLLLYQTSPKFRYEPDPKFGLIRGNEFIMNDLYSFDTNRDCASKTYQLVTEAYKRIFASLQLDCKQIESNMGSIGGVYSHEYQLIVSSGEDTILECNDCGSAFNSDLAKRNGDKQECIKCYSDNIKSTKSLELGHTFLLSTTYSKPFSAKFTGKDRTGRYNFEMGCYGLGLTRILGAGVDLLSIVPRKTSDQDTFLQVRWPNGVEPYKVGIVVPAKRSRQHHANSSDFIERFVRRALEENQIIDILVEDRDKESMGKRIRNLQSLGLPNIVVIGQRFLQDEPEIELLRLSRDKKSYEPTWMNENQLHGFMRQLDHHKVSVNLK